MRTRIPDTIPRDYSIEDEGLPAYFAVKSAALKEAIDDLEWPGSSISITISPDPPGVIFKGEGHGDLQIEFLDNSQTDLFIAFHCDQIVSYRSCKLTLEEAVSLAFDAGMGQGTCFILAVYLSPRRSDGNVACSNPSYWYKYKFLRATTANIPTSIMKDNRGSKLTIGADGLLKVQHLISVRPSPTQHHIDPNNSQQHGRVSYVEFYVLPDAEDGAEDAGP